MDTNIQKILREGLIKKGGPKANQNQLLELHQLVEKRIRVGDNITKKLNRINTKLSRNLLNFINSSDIKDDANVDYVDYDNSNEKLFTVGYKDQRGNTKERLMKFNKLLTYLGGSIEHIKSYEVEELMSHLKQGDTDNMKIVNGEDILWAYHCENYDEGETMGSCMRFSAAQKYLQMYTDNPNQVSCIVLVNPDNNKVRGRALVWTLDNGNKYMDRVYTTNNQYKAEFTTFAEENGFEIGNPSDTVTLEQGGEFEHYPYLDMFQYYNPYTNVLSSDDSNDTDELELSDQNGGHTNDHDPYSEHHGKRIPEALAAYVEHMEDWMYYYETKSHYDGRQRVFPEDSGVVELTAGEHEGEYALYDEAVELYNGDFCLWDDAYGIDKGHREGEFALGDDIVDDVDGNVILRDESVEATLGSAEGEFIHEDDAWEVRSPANDDVIGIIHDKDTPEFDDDYDLTPFI